MTKEEWAKIKYFIPSEFDDPTAPGSGLAMMDYSFIERLDRIRKIWSVPLIVNSGYRSQAHNDAVGGVKDSAHTRGLAADLKMNGLAQTIRFAVTAGQNGFKRVGIDMQGKFVHLDSDTSLPEAIWFYNHA